MEKMLANDSSLNMIADVIRSQMHTSSPLVFPEDYIVSIENLPTSGTARKLLDGTLRSYYDEEQQYLCSRAFQYCTELESAYIPNCTSIGESAFAYCTSLNSLVIGTSNLYTLSTRLNNYGSQVVYAVGSPFEGCSGVYATLPNCKYIDQTFVGDEVLSGLTIPECSYISGTMFIYNSNLQCLSAEKCEWIAGYSYGYVSQMLSSRQYGTFTGCGKLASVYLPACSYIGPYTFDDCQITNLYAPNCRTFHENAIDLADGADVTLGVTALSRTLPISSMTTMGDLGYGSSTAAWSSVIQMVTSSGSIDLHLPKAEFVASLAGGDSTAGVLSYLGTLDIPIADNIGSSAFSNAPKLIYVNTPECLAVYQYAFCSCANLSSIYMPICSYVGDHAFDHCVNLERPDFEKLDYIGAYAFRDCPKISGDLSINASSINDGAFYGTGITSVELNGCISLGKEAFANCSQLTTAVLPSCKTLGSSCFADCVNMTYLYAPECTSVGFDILGSKSHINMSAYLGLTVFNLMQQNFNARSLGYTVDMYLPSCSIVPSLTGGFAQTMFRNLYMPVCIEIGDYGLGNGNLKAISLPECQVIQVSGLTRNDFSTLYLPKCTGIGSFAIASCPNLTTASLPVCMEVRDSAFLDCISLTNIAIPECVTIGRDVFKNCPISSIVSPRCTSVGVSAFYNCSYLQTVNLSACSIIGSNAFYSCVRLESVILPKCETFGSSVFYNCQQLKTISIPKIKSVPEMTFYNCTALESVTLPNTCSAILAQAFSNCNALKSLTLQYRGVVTTSANDMNVFTGTLLSTTGKIFVPSEYISAYVRSPMWSMCSSRIFAI